MVGRQRRADESAGTGPAPGTSMRKIRLAVLLIVLLSLASVAAAVTLAELQQGATALHSTYQAVASQAAACTDGECAERSTIESAFTAAESQRTQLHADRETLSPCGNCQDLDATIQAIDGVAEDVAGIIEGWEGQG